MKDLWCWHQGDAGAAKKTPIAGRPAVTVCLARGGVWVQAGLALVLAAVVGGCETPSPEAIEVWKGTVKGPGKLEDAVANGRLDPNLRAQAALALEEIGKADRVAVVLADMNEAARAPLIEALLAVQTQRLARGADQAAQARDALMALRPFADPSRRAQIDGRVLEAIKTQLGATGQLGGSQSLSRIVDEIGAPAAPVLAALLGEPKVNHLEIVNLLDRVVDQTLRDQAATHLVAVLPRLPAVTPGHYEALGRLGGKAAVDHLVNTVQSASKIDEAAAAARALQLKPRPELRDLALRMAGDVAVPGLVRDEMFGLAETCCGPDVRDGLLRIIATTKVEKGQPADRAELVRYRAYEAVLAAAGAGAIRPALESFPVKGKYPRRDIEDLLVKDIAKLTAAPKAGSKVGSGVAVGGEAVTAALLDTLGSPAVLARMTALLALEKLGDARHADAVSRLTRDRGKLDGFGSTTVGDEAQRVASMLSKPK